MILEGTREEMTGLGGIMKQGQFSNWLSQQSLFRVGKGQRETEEIREESRIHRSCLAA